MKHNLTPEQITTICLALFVIGLGIYAAIEHVKEKYYVRGYSHGYNRAKWIYRQKTNGRSGSDAR